MYFDSHVHTKYSADSEMAGLDAYQAARNKGMGIVFTEHIDFNYPGNRYNFSFDPAKYMDEYGALRGMYLLLGAEIGMGEECLKEAEEFAGKAAFDVIVGSIHIVDGQDLYEKEFYEGKTKEQAYKRYLGLMKDMVEKNTYIDVLGHIDYICRYAPYDDPALNYDEFAPEIDAVLKAALAANTILEINTRRFGDAKVRDELKKIYARYHELGGKFVTLASDAHTKETVGAYIPEAEALAKECGLEPVIFYERQLMPLSADASGC